MAHLALGIQNSGPRDRQPATSIPSAFTVALDTVSILNIPREKKIKDDKIASGPASTDIPWNCRVFEKATGITYTLKGLKVSFLALRKKYSTRA